MPGPQRTLRSHVIKMDFSQITEPGQGGGGNKAGMAGGGDISESPAPWKLEAAKDTERWRGHFTLIPST